MSYLGPADHLAVSLELGAMEDFDAGDGLHGLAVDGADDTEKAGRSRVIHKNKNQKKLKLSLLIGC